MKLLPEWTEKLPLQQQAVLVLALRGPDGFPKHHQSKPILYSYRGCLVASASLGRHLHIGEHAGTLMSLDCFEDDSIWNSKLARFFDVVDELPLHYFTHLMHGAQVMGYKHPEPLMQRRWLEFYRLCCEYTHTDPEPEPLMDLRLSDFGRSPEYVAP